MTIGGEGLGIGDDHERHPVYVADRVERWPRRHDEEGHRQQCGEQSEECSNKTGDDGVAASDRHATSARGCGAFR